MTFDPADYPSDRELHDAERWREGRCPCCGDWLDHVNVCTGCGRRWEWRWGEPREID